jgi:hypothetical protein
MDPEILEDLDRVYQEFLEYSNNTTTNTNTTTTVSKLSTYEYQIYSLLTILAYCLICAYERRILAPVMYRPQLTLKSLSGQEMFLIIFFSNLLYKLDLRWNF